MYNTQENQVLSSKWETQKVSRKRGFNSISQNVLDDDEQAMTEQLGDTQISDAMIQQLLLKNCAPNQSYCEADYKSPMPTQRVQNLIDHQYSPYSENTILNSNKNEQIQIEKNELRQSSQQDQTHLIHPRFITEQSPMVGGGYQSLLDAGENSYVFEDDVLSVRFTRNPTPSPISCNDSESESLRVLCEKDTQMDLQMFDKSAILSDNINMVNQISGHSTTEAYSNIFNALLHKHDNQLVHLNDLKTQILSAETQTQSFQNNINIIDKINESIRKNVAEHKIKKSKQDFKLKMKQNQLIQIYEKIAQANDDGLRWQSMINGMLFQIEQINSQIQSHQVPDLQISRIYNFSSSENQIDANIMQIEILPTQNELQLQVYKIQKEEEDFSNKKEIVIKNTNEMQGYYLSKIQMAKNEHQKLNLQNQHFEMLRNNAYFEIQIIRFLILFFIVLQIVLVAYYL